MSPAAQSILAEWSLPIPINLLILLTLLVYLRGWLALRRSAPELIAGWRLAAFAGGMFSLWVAIGSPLEAFDDASLSVHMVQHVLLMLVVPPLALLGAPSLPLLHGLPQWFVRVALGPVLRWPPLQRTGRFLTHPAACWILASIALLAWHLPALFELALRSDGWHEVEHACFLFTSILFWWPVVQPYPSEPRWPSWTIPLYLFFGMGPGSALSAFLIFCDRVLYPSYSQTSAVLGIAPLGDQILAGALMWFFGFLFSIVPAVIITVRLLSSCNLGISPIASGASIPLLAETSGSDVQPPRVLVNVHGAFPLKQKG